MSGSNSTKIGEFGELKTKSGDFLLEVKHGNIT